VTEKASESRIFVAWHHFHPVAIVAYGVTEDSKGNKKYGLPDTIPRDFVRNKIGDGNGYSDADQVEPGGDTKIALLLQPRPMVKLKLGHGAFGDIQMLQVHVMQLPSRSRYGSLR
jgi:hypothetical protein